MFNVHQHYLNYAELIIEDFISFKIFFNSSNFMHVKRGINQAVHIVYI